MIVVMFDTVEKSEPWTDKAGLGSWRIACGPSRERTYSTRWNAEDSFRALDRTLTQHSLARRLEHQDHEASLRNVN